MPAGDSGSPQGTVPCNTEVHNSVVTAASEGNLPLLLRLGDYYGDAEFSPQSLPGAIVSFQQIDTVALVNVNRDKHLRIGLCRQTPWPARLQDDAALLWESFEELHHRHGLPGELEIPMESFARAVEIVLKESELRDGPTYRPGPALWNLAARNCGYIQSRKAVSEGFIAAYA